MARKIKDIMEQHHCSNCGCIFVNCKDPGKCPMCDEKYIKIIKNQIKKRKILEQR